MDGAHYCDDMSEMGPGRVKTRISSLAREVFYRCAVLPNGVLRNRPKARYEGNPETYARTEFFSV
jgi:hypothetical protein